jgi:hypothetical protein
MDGSASKETSNLREAEEDWGGDEHQSSVLFTLHHLGFKRESAPGTCHVLKSSAHSGTEKLCAGNPAVVGSTTP